MSPLDRLIHSAYEAPLRPGGWADLVETVRGVMGAEGVLLGMRIGGGSAVTHFAGYDAAFIESYVTEFAYADPWTAEAAARPEGNTARSAELVSNDALLHTDFYNDFLRGYGLLEGFGGKKDRGHRQWRLRGHHRPEGAQLRRRGDAGDPPHRTSAHEAGDPDLDAARRAGKQ
ncbi:MAG: hypothetical protein JRH01_21390 [Deltaproteobacteria bacterium]|nr:hypothetical protein [Deltaproteobacteria bacterium]MBW2396196.1 hypothetical protein [Deltaproteobacteria bacterium]